MSTEYCPKCSTPQNTVLTTTERKETGTDGKEHTIQSRDFHCEKCHTFVRNEQVEIPEVNLSASNQN
jgi:hypothetical protein